MRAKRAIAAAVPIRLLLVNVDHATADAIEVPIGRAGLPYQLSKATCRDRFFDLLSDQRPDLVLCRERGIPGLALEEVFETARQCTPNIPVVVLRDRKRRRGPTARLPQGTSDYVSLARLECLPAVIESALSREHCTENALMSVPDDYQRAAQVLRENQKLLTIGRLAGAIAHEINNPLESIANLLFLMEAEANIPDPVRGYLAMAQRELARVLQISKQTLNFYREAPSAVRVPLNGLLEEVLVLYGSRIAEKNLHIIRRFDRGMSLLVFPGEMRQVFANLIGNAIEASFPDGKVFLRLRRSRSWADPGVTGMRVTIADQGPGIADELRHRVGEIFLTTKGQGGTGLGLWVSKSIIRRYGGSLFLHSSTGENHGTVFSVFLPTNLRPQAVEDTSEDKGVRFP